MAEKTAIVAQVVTGVRPCGPHPSRFFLDHSDLGFLSYPFAPILLELIRLRSEEILQQSLSVIS